MLPLPRAAIALPTSRTSRKFAVRLPWLTVSKSGLRQVIQAFGGGPRRSC